MTQQFIARLPEVGPEIIIEHGGEDIDLVITETGQTLPGLITIPELESWEPAIYQEALALAGWRVIGEWTPDGADTITTVAPQETETGK